MTSHFSIYGRSFLVGICLFSNLLSQYNGDDIIRKGVDAFYNYNYNISNDILDKAIYQFPEHPSVHLVWVASQWRYDESRLSIETIYDNFENNLSKAERSYDSLMVENPNDMNYQLYYGSSLGLKARIYLGQKKWLSTLYSAYSGFRVIQNVHLSDSSIIDSYLPIGIVEYYTGMGNIFVRTAAEVLGITPSKKEGLKKMEKVANEGQWAWMEAMSVLSYIYQFFDIDQIKGLRYSKIIAEKYPNNFDFQIHFTESLLQNNQLEKALYRLESHNDNLQFLTKNYQKRYRSYVDYLWAHYFYLSGQNGMSLNYAENSIKNYSAELDVWLANAYLLKGKLLDISNKRYEAKLAYRKCLFTNNQTQANNLAKLYLEQPFKK